MENEIEGSNAICDQRNTILSLSDEVLVNICSYLTSEAAISLSCTCRRFNDLLFERKLIRYMNLRTAYSVTPDLMKSFFRPYARCEHVETISLTGCYWLTSGEILWVLKRLTNLKNLHVNDTNLSIKHLTCVMTNIKSIECLSWTFPSREKSDSCIKDLSKQLHCLKSLQLWTNGFGYYFIPQLLENCSSLERLEVSSYRIKNIPANYIELPHFQRLNFSKIKSLILNIPPEVPFTMAEILGACDQDIAWNCFWIRDTQLYLFFRHISMTYAKESFALALPLKQEEMFHVLQLKSLRYFKFFTDDESYDENYDILLRKSSITHLFWDIQVLPRSLPEGLQYLKISSSCLLMNNIPSRSLLVYDALPHLTFISIPACIILSPTSGCSSGVMPQAEETSQNKNIRQSHLQKATNTDCFLKILIDNAPNLQKLEMKCKRGCTGVTPNVAASLGVIRWPQLESLVLENIPLIDLSPLVQVCTNCPRLRNLNLRNLGISGTFSQTQKLVQAINLLGNLEDFRFEHPDVRQLMTIINALSKRPKLCRVAIICENTWNTQDLSSYFDLIEECSHLVFLLVCVAAITKQMEREFQKVMKTKFLNNRKYLWASLQGRLRDDTTESIPLVHYLDMFNEESHIPPLKD